MDRLLSPVRQAPPWLVPLLCWLAMVFDGYEVYVYGATLPGIIGPQPWGVTIDAAAGVASANLTGVLLGAVVSGTLADILGRRKLFITSLTLFSASALACALAVDFVSFGILRFITGLGIGGITPTVIALTAEFSRARYRSRMIGLVLTGPAIGGMIAPLTALAVLDRFGFRPAYAFGALPLITILPAAIAWLPESVSFLRARGKDAAADATAARFDLEQETDSAEPVQHVPDSRVAALFSRGNRWVTPALWFMMLMSNLVVFGLGTWLPQFLVRGGFPLSFALLMNVLLSGATVVSTLVSATIADRLGAAKPLVLAGLILGFLGYSVVFVFGGGVGVIFGLALVGLGTGSAHSLLQVHVAGYYPPQYRATGLGWAIGVGRFGAIAGPQYGAIFISLSGDVSIVAVAFGIPALVGAALMATLPRRARGQDAEPAQGVQRVRPVIRR